SIPAGLHEEPPAPFHGDDRSTADKIGDIADHFFKGQMRSFLDIFLGSGEDIVEAKIAEWENRNRIGTEIDSEGTPIPIWWVHLDRLVGPGTLGDVTFPGGKPIQRHP